MSECLRMRLTHATSPLHASVSRELLEYLFPYIGRNPLLVNLVSRLVTSLTRACKFASCARALLQLSSLFSFLRLPIAIQIRPRVHFVYARAFRPARPSRSSRAHEFDPWSPYPDPYISPNRRIHPECSFRACMLTRKHVVAHQPTRANLTRA
jgi:hypothetical protein